MYAPALRPYRCAECGRRYKSPDMARECCLRDIAKIMAEPPRKPHRVPLTVRAIR